MRDQHGVFRVLEDNARTPSGVSYVIENWHAMLRAFPDLIQGIRLRPVHGYGLRLREAMCEIAPALVDDPQVVLLSRGIYYLAYFKHVPHAREMSVLGLIAAWRKGNVALANAVGAGMAHD